MRRRLSLAPLLLLVAAACGGSVVESPGPGGTGAPPSAGTGGTTASAGSGGMSASAGSVGVDEQACLSNSDCILVPAGCCTCGNTTLADYKAINAAYVSQDAARCNGQGCGCPSQQPPSTDDDPTSYFVPTCRAGRCSTVDFRATDITTCKTAADCFLRSGTACCARCGDTPVAFNVNGEPAFEQLVCAGEPAECGSNCESFTDVGVDCTAVDRPPSDQAVLPPPHCIVIPTGLCTPTDPCGI